MGELNLLLEDSGIPTEDLFWHKAKIPTQYGASNDCGPYSSIFSLLYLQQLEQQGLLNEQPSESKDIETVGNVLLELPKGMDTRQFGYLCRRCMLHSLREGAIEWNSPVFGAKVKFT